jgi:lipopolysaccharide transport system ATP-binding protein
MEPVINVENLGKRYEIRRGNASYSTFRESLASVFRSKTSSETFWALKDLNFEIKQGERVGIIGRNGAGKSTLLKVLSRIVTPTTGRVTLNGRIASLLEVGTGFHPELSGRENIYLNGSILGMSKSEIRGRFDEIVAFSEVEKFLDTPVKRYSSGMYVRLAFAVAAHLEPEVLIVDEVLAVGDAEFQRKCLGKMKDVAGTGRTVILVSHNMAAVQHLCDRAIYLRSGELVMSGDTASVIRTYLSATGSQGSFNIAQRTDRSGNGKVRFQLMELLDEEGRQIQHFISGTTAVFKLRLMRFADIAWSQIHLSAGIDDEIGQRITLLSNEVSGSVIEESSESLIDVCIRLPKLPLKQGEYSMTLFSSWGGEVCDWVQDAVKFTVESGDFFHTGKLPPDGQGNFLLEHSFYLHK